MEGASTIELDSHADTFVMGKSFLLHSTDGTMVDVAPFTNDLATIKDIKVGSGVTAHDAADGQTYLLGQDEN